MQNKVKKAAFNVFNASKFRVGIVAAQFNRDFCEELVGSAIATLKEYKVSEKKIDVFRVAGSVEIPVILKKLAETKKYDCLVAIGVIIRGDTPHFDYVAKFVTEGVLRVQLDYTLPVGFSVLTCENEAQVEKRLHVGGEAAEAALQNAYLINSL